MLFFYKLVFLKNSQLNLTQKNYRKTADIDAVPY